jgi:hypothetical protein
VIFSIHVTTFVNVLVMQKNTFEKRDGWVQVLTKVGRIRLKMIEEIFWRVQPSSQSSQFASAA